MDFRSLFIDKDKIVMANMELGVALNSLDEAIVLNQLNYWIERNKDANRNFHDGHYWVYNSYEAWRKQDFPVWSATKIKRIFTSLEGKGIVLSANYNKLAIDKTKWYTIDYDKLKKFIEEYSKGQNETTKDQDEISKDTDDQPIGQNDQTLDQSERALPNTNYRDYTTDITNRDLHTDMNALEDVKRPSSKGSMYASVPEEHKDAPPKNQSRYIPPDYTEEQLIDHIKPTIEENLKTVQEDCGMEYNPKRADDIVEIVTDFFEQYREKTGHRHKILPDATLINIMYQYFNPPECLWNRNEPSTYSDMAEEYFNTNFNARGGYDGEIALSISHFMSDKIRENCYQRIK